MRIIKKNKLFIMIMIISIILIMISCSNQTKAHDNYDTTIFEEVSHQNLNSITGDSEDNIFILKNKETGKNFILYKGYRKGGLTPLN